MWIVQVHVIHFFQFFRYPRTTISLVSLYIILISSQHAQSKEIKILRFGNRYSRPQSLIANFLNASHSIQSTSHHKSISLEINAVPSNESSIEQNSNNRTASHTTFQTFQVKSISSSENGERNGRVSVIRAALRIAARHALEATLNLYDKREPNMVHRGKVIKTFQFIVGLINTSIYNNFNRTISTSQSSGSQTFAI